MQYCKTKIAGGTYFFTIVTYNRNHILCTPSHVGLLKDAFKYVINRHPFEIDAIVILPDHLHCILTLPANDADYPMRLQLMKAYFSRYFKGGKNRTSSSRKRRKEKTVWQRRYWEHLIRDEEDYINHIEYIHYNPVKHGFANAPKDRQYSSFQKYVDEGIYDPNWGVSAGIKFPGSVGSE